MLIFVNDIRIERKLRYINLYLEIFALYDIMQKEEAKP